MEGMYEEYFPHGMNDTTTYIILNIQRESVYKIYNICKAFKIVMQVPIVFTHLDIFSLVLCKSEIPHALNRI